MYFKAIELSGFDFSDVQKGRIDFSMVQYGDSYKVDVSFYRHNGFIWIYQGYNTGGKYRLFRTTERFENVIQFYRDNGYMVSYNGLTEASRNNHTFTESTDY